MITFSLVVAALASTVEGPIGGSSHPPVFGVTAVLRLAPPPPFELPDEDRTTRQRRKP